MCLIIITNTNEIGSINKLERIFSKVSNKFLKKNKKHAPSNHFSWVRTAKISTYSSLHKLWSKVAYVFIRLDSKWMVKCFNMILIKKKAFYFCWNVCKNTIDSMNAFVWWIQLWKSIIRTNEMAMGWDNIQGWSRMFSIMFICFVWCDFSGEFWILRGKFYLFVSWKFPIT